MKRNFLFVFLFVVTLLAAGCGQKENDLNLPGNDLQTENSADKDSGNTEDSGKTETSENTGSTDETGEEQEPYVLTFSANTIEDEEMTSDIFADSKLTMLNIWATYCNPCLSEMPDLGEIAAAYDAEEFQLIGIVSDVMEGDDAENVDYAKELIEETGAAYPHLLLNESLYKNLVGAVDAVPTTFFVNQKGELLGYVRGAQKKEVWEEIIDGILKDME